MNEAQINARFDEVKLNLLCKSFDFILNRSTDNPQGLNLNCQDLEELARSLPSDAEWARNFYRSFANKQYKSYGPNKLEARSKKLFEDIESELRKRRPRDGEYQALVSTFSLELNRSLQEDLGPIEEENISEPVQNLDPIRSISEETKENNEPEDSTMLIYISLIFLASIGGMAFLFWKIQNLEKLLEEREQRVLDKYSRLDNRIDTLSPQQDFQALRLKFNFLNEQLNALQQNMQVLMQRNQNKMSAEELFSKRTEHLEGYSFNPNVQVYFAKVRPNQSSFLVQDLRMDVSRDSIFKIEIDLKNPSRAIYNISNRSEYHQIALANADTMLAPACQYVNEPYNDSRIINLENGILEKKEERWLILKKAKIAFE